MTSQVCIETEGIKSQALTFQKVGYFETAIEWLLLTAIVWWQRTFHTQQCREALMEQQ